jgi:molybdenum cofactor cytidylyltransferase
VTERIGGIVLAAGEGRRFGGAKQLAELAGRPLLEHAIAAMAAVPAIHPIVVVLGARADDVRAGVDLADVAVVLAEDWQEGLSASLRAGIDAIGEAEAYIVCLGDQPFITPQVIARFVGEHGTCRAAYAGEPGHPVRMTRGFAHRARELRGEAGARELLRDVRIVECGHLCSAQDIDTREQLEAVRR